MIRRRMHRALVLTGWPCSWPAPRPALTTRPRERPRQRRHPHPVDPGRHRVRVEGLPAAYNATHKNQVQVTAYPNEEYPAKLASAAGAKALPDLFASDVVFAPQYASQGLWLDITDKFNALPVKDKVAPAHVRNGTWNKKNYAVPHTIDMSVMLYNKDLFTKAGLDPEKPPTTLTEFAAAARAVDKLGGDINGTYFGGNCGGCNVFTLWPSVWAAGGDVMNAEGTASTIDSKEMADVFALYRKLYDEGVAAPASKDEAGPTWLGALQSGKIGIAPGAVGVARHHRGEGRVQGRRRADQRHQRGRVDVRGRRLDRHRRHQQARRAGLGLPGLDPRRRGPDRGHGEGQGRADAHRPRLEQVLLGRPARRGHQQPDGQGQDAVREELQRHLQRPAEPVEHRVPRRAVRRRAEVPR